MSWMLIQILWFGLATSIILIDRQLMNKPLDVENLENVDLKDRSVAPFLVAMVFLGGFAIPFYMWHSRRTVIAVLVGVGLMLAGAVGLAVLAGRGQ